MPAQPEGDLTAGESGQITLAAEFRAELATAHRRAVPHEFSLPPFPLPARHPQRVSHQWPSVPPKSGFP
ncbi:hypothetical protein SSPO_018580 [Streptomyces antimycoticus]|uniref:Uncharacterized protein n=1 Tax=Streptomyces antimycoticus TaxID=68175 RepID=A0A499UGC6_9ACTN|nr:hypothetical protein SSPO_018580 [Streptomyces antimycoticus]